METNPIIYLFAGIAFVAVVVFCWVAFFKPRAYIPGVFSNPRRGKRAITRVTTPDIHDGKLLDVINEEGTGNYSSLIILADGQQIPVRCNFERDCRWFNLKQAAAGSAPPILICCVDQEGVRHPEMFDAIYTPGNMLKNMGTLDMEEENKQLRIQHAKYKRTAEGDWADQTEKVASTISRVKNAMFQYYNEDQQQGGEQPPNQGGRR